MAYEIKQNDWEEAQAQKIISLLDKDLATIDPLTVSKLKYGRESALSKMAAHETFSHRGVLHLLGGHGRHQKLWLTLIGLLLVLSVFLLTRENVLDTNHSDAYLLGSELPPEAYLNEGFDTWLSENSQP